jgi:hypothetical protein
MGFFATRSKMAMKYPGWTVGKSRFYPCSSVSIRGFKSVLLNRSGSGPIRILSPTPAAALSFLDPG